MAYEKNTWATGDVITAEKLNNIETGVEAIDASGIKIYHVNIDMNNQTVQTDIPDVNSWQTFASACVDLTDASPCQFLIRAFQNDYPTIQILGSVAKGSSWGVIISESQDLYFRCGDDDGNFAYVYGNGTDIGVYSYEFV